MNDNRENKKSREEYLQDLPWVLIIILAIAIFVASCLNIAMQRGVLSSHWAVGFGLIIATDTLGLFFRKGYLAFF